VTSEAPNDQAVGRHAALVRLLSDIREVGHGGRQRATEWILAAVCRYTGWPLGHAYRFDRKAELLVPAIARHERQRGLHRPLLDATLDVSLAPGEDLPGLALVSRRPQWTNDITLQRRFTGIEVARAEPVRAAVALPVLIKSDVSVVLEFFCARSQEIDQDLLTVLDHVATDWGHSLERRRRSRPMGVPRVKERRAAAEEFRLHGAAAAHVRDAIVVSTTGKLGRAPTILYVNAAFTRITGYTEMEALGQSFSLLAGAKTSRAALQAIHARFRKGIASYAELVAYRKDGQEFPMEWHASPIVESDGRAQHFVSIQRDITEERSDRQALRRADRDALTGLATRDVLEKRIRLSIDRAGERPDYRFAVLFLDLDGFKAINDEHGHVVGDQLLASAARRLEGAIRPGDALARFGGDEFVMLLHAVTDVHDVTLVADRVQERMAAPFEIQGRSLHVTTSIGVALSHAAYLEPEDVIRDADTAMYAAKRQGQGGVEFFERNADSSAPTLESE
jgi:diguanylate cyclase (GGDEF)-like protein/PAS domain S-box-containing protein